MTYQMYPRFFLSFCLLVTRIFTTNHMHDLTHLQKIMNRELKKVEKWLDANRLA